MFSSVVRLLFVIIKNKCRCITYQTTIKVDNAIIQFQRVTECLWNYSDIWKWDDTYELGEYCFSLLRDHVSTELFSNYQEIEELAIQVDSSYEEGHFKLDIHLPKDLNSDNEQEILSF